MRGANSELAARAALAADRQGKYRDMHIALMKVPANAYSPEIIERIGKSVGLDIERMKRDMEDKALHDLIAQHVTEFEPGWPRRHAGLLHQRQVCRRLRPGEPRGADRRSARQREEGRLDQPASGEDGSA